MKKRITTAVLMAAVTMSVLFGTGSLTAQAADVMVPGVKVAAIDNANAQRAIFTSVFDAKYYAEANPDVVAVFGTDPKALFTHYLTCGMVEGRNASATFNLTAYEMANPDLVAVFGTDSNNVINYFIHYANFGKNEGRVATVKGANIVAPSATSTGSSYVAPSNGGNYVAPSNGGNTVAPTPAPQPSAPAPAQEVVPNNGPTPTDDVTIACPGFSDVGNDEWAKANK